MKSAVWLAVGVVVGYQIAQHYTFEFKLEEREEGNE